MKPKKCIICFEWFVPRFKTTERCCGVPCAITHATNLRKTKEQRDWKKEKSELKNKLKTHSDWTKELQDLINHIARLIDNGSDCISCQKSTGSQRHGGHRWRTSTYPEIRFHLDNLASQCAYCNDKLSGNSDGYDIGLESVYGETYFNWVKVDIKIKYPTLKLSIPELTEAKETAKQIIKELKALDMVYPPKVRIELRKKYNKRLGIYK